MTVGGNRTWALLTVAAGLGVLALYAVFAGLPEVKAAQNAGCFVGAPPVVRFEFARTVEDLTALFGSADDACRAPRVAAMDAVNRVDLAAFIPTYSLFCIFGAIFAARGGRPPLVLMAILATIAAAVADLVETRTLLAVTADLDRAGPLLARSSAAAWSKFALLAIHGLLVARVCLGGEPRRWLLALALALPALGVAAAAIDPAGLTPAMTLAFALGWAGLLAFAVKDSVWPERSAPGRVARAEV